MTRDLEQRNKELTASIMLCREAWVAAFEGICGWPRQRTERWANRYAEAMSDPTSGFFHWSPMSYVVKWLIPFDLPRIRANMGLPYELEGLLVRGNPNWDREPSTHDWKAAAARIDKHLALYGSSLQAICRQLDDEKIGLDG